MHLSWQHLLDVVSAIANCLFLFFQLSIDSPESFIGKSVKKIFVGHGEFLGTIVGYDYTQKFWRIEYTDGDCEDVRSLQNCNFYVFVEFIILFGFA